MGKRFQRITDLIGLLNSLYPPNLAEEWDNTGLQVGDPAQVLDKVLVALDPSLPAVEAAHQAGAQVLLTHHPLLFRPLQRLTPEDAVGRVIWAAVVKGVAVISAHTNLDSAAGGLNDWLAKQLGVRNAQPLQAAKGDYLKLVVFVPASHEEPVAEALFSGGAGQIGAYDCCSFRTPGIGTFRPGETTRPYLGQIGQTERAEEIRLETIVPKTRLGRVLEKMYKAHPYEEVAYDLIPLQNQTPSAGLGRIGTLEATTTLQVFAEMVRDRLGSDALKIVGDPDLPVHKVAVCGGSGAGTLNAAKHQGADVLVTGDVKYHEARHAEDLEVSLIDAGHFATEQLMIEHVVTTLGQASQARGWNLAFEAYTGESDPFRMI